MPMLRRETWNTVEARQIVALTLAIWLLMLGIYQLTDVIAGRFRWIYDLPADIVVVALMAALVLPAYPLVLRLRAVAPWQRWLVLLLFALVIATLQSTIILVENWLLGIIPSQGGFDGQLLRRQFAPMLRNHFYMTFANIALISFAVQVHDRAMDRVALADERARADRARLAALRLQLNPHFLFNALNAVSSLVGAGRAADAEEMIQRLSEFLRQTLDEGDDVTVPLSHELASLDSYIAVERVRFGDRLRIELRIERSLRAKLRVPSLILQPIVENALKHGTRDGQPVVIALSAWESPDGAVIEVRNDGPASATGVSPVPGLGVGLENVRERLATAYGPAAWLEAGAVAEGGWRVCLHLPPLSPAP